MTKQSCETTDGSLSNRNCLYNPGFSSLLILAVLISSTPAEEPIL